MAWATAKGIRSADRYYEYSIFPWKRKVPVKTAISNINVSLQGQRLSCKHGHPCNAASLLFASFLSHRYD